MGYASCQEDNLDARGEPVKRDKKKRVSCQEDNLEVKTEPVKLQKLEKQKERVCVLQLEVEQILKHLAKQERLSDLTVVSWAEYVSGYYKKYGGLPTEVDLVSLVGKALISLNHKRLARAIRRNSSNRWKVFETKTSPSRYELT